MVKSVDLTGPIQVPITPELQARIDRFRAILRQYDRVALGGVPVSGKSVFARFSDGRRIVHTDDYKGHGWEQEPKLAAQDLKGCPKYLLMGVRATGCIAAGLDAQVLVWLNDPMEPSKVTPGQWGMVKGRRTRFRRFQREFPDVKTVVI